jgi:vacuolar-type H+-ATPase subunit I/STV1
MKAEKPTPTSRAASAAVDTVSEAAAIAALSGNGSATGEAVGVDKIRDLLFGNQMQDYDRRFTKLEERFMQRFKDIELETSRNLGAFESNSKKQVDSLAGQLREEKDQRADADKENERALREQNQALEKRIRALSDQLSQLDRDMSDRITREAQSLRDEIKQKNAGLMQTLESMFAELSTVKTDRSLLASLFVEVAKCLNQDLGPKTGKVGAEARGFSAGAAS